MSRFTETPIVVELTALSGDKAGVILHVPVTWQMVYGDPSSTITVPRSRRSDGPSVPRALRWVTGDVTRPDIMRAGLIHDELYGTHADDQGVELDRATADRVFREVLMVCGYPRWRSWLCWAAVRVGGSSAWRAQNAAQPENTIAEAAMDVTLDHLERAWRESLGAAHPTEGDAGRMVELEEGNEA